MNINEVGKRLKESGLRVTPQRVAVLEALMEGNNHPSADDVVRIVREQYPNIAVGTIYHILDNLVQKGILNKVQTEQNVVRYDAVIEPHIHLYSGEENRIEDYFDEELMELVKNYLKKNRIIDFEVNRINLQLIGEFKNK